jgi:hypothetical protein
VFQFEVAARHVPGGVKGLLKPQTGKMASGFKFQLGTSQIRNKTTTKLTLTFRGEMTSQNMQHI